LINLLGINNWLLNYKMEEWSILHDTYYISKKSLFEKLSLRSKYNEKYTKYMLIMFNVNSNLYTIDWIYKAIQWQHETFL